MILMDTLMRTFSQFWELYPVNVVCARCEGLQCCPECHTIVFRFVTDTESASGMISYTVKFEERRLDEKVWNKHLVFPFARQRQYEWMQTGSSWKLW